MRRPAVGAAPMLVAGASVPNSSLLLPLLPVSLLALTGLLSLLPLPPRSRLVLRLSCHALCVISSRVLTSVIGMRLSDALAPMVWRRSGCAWMLFFPLPLCSASSSVQMLRCSLPFTASFAPASRTVVAAVACRRAMAPSLGGSALLRTWFAASASWRVYLGSGLPLLLPRQDALPPPSMRCSQLRRGSHWCPLAQCMLLPR